ncbi:kinesin light chain [Ceratobasidium sp. AG-Ba]|nr:kinesin light chain [Ceratobasidium sp. AG-Ba]
MTEGGGARGLSSLLILQETMNRLRGRHKLGQAPKVHEYFDIVAGTGTGAVIACMVGRLQIPINDAIEHYAELAKVFKDRKWTKLYSITKLQDALKAIVKSVTMEENTGMMDTNESEKKCRVMVFAMSEHNLNGGIPRIFRSYPVVANQMGDCAIWEAVSASMAHPEMFKPVLIGESYLRQAFVDGGLGCNNPTPHVLTEVKTLFQDRQVSTVLCIGAGHPDTIRLSQRGLFKIFMPSSILTATRGIAYDAERVAQDMDRRFRSVSNVYFRLRVNQGLQSIALKDWEMLSQVAAHTRAYVETAETSIIIDGAVRAIRNRKGVINTQHIDGEIPRTTTSVSNLLYPAPSRFFTGREDKIEQIVACISNGDRQRCVFVLYGLGGTGKTQIALKTVQQTTHLWTDVVFVDATSRDSIIHSLTAFAMRKGIGDSHANAIRWLGNQCERWLMVFDNADDPSFDIREFFPGGNSGSILVTTRMISLSLLGQGPSPSFAGISGMESNEAMDLLVKTSSIEKDDLSEDDRQATARLLENFGYLALAITQAGCYIAASRLSISRYEAMFHQYRQATLEASTRLPMVDAYQGSVYTTWHMSYELLGTDARRLLHLIAFMHYDGITEDIFRRAAISLREYTPAVPATSSELEIQGYVTSCLQPYLYSDGTWNSSAFLGVMAELVSHSLVEFDRARSTYTLPILVHDWASTTIVHPLKVAIDHTALLLAASIDYENTPTSVEYKRQIETHVHRLLVRSSEISGNNAALFAEVFYCTKDWTSYERLEQIAVDSRRASLGEYHTATLDSIGRLAIAYREQGRLVEAKSLQEDLMTSRWRILGDTHTSTVAAMSELASTYLLMGRYGDAESLLLQAVDANRQIFGEEHPSTLGALVNLASVYYRQGRYGDAEAIQLLVVEIGKRMLGERHSATLSGMRDLSFTYCRLHAYDKAVLLQSQVLEATEFAHGKNHPETLTAMESLASTLSKQGRHEQAELLSTRVVDGRRRVLGLNDPLTRDAMDRLLTTYRDIGPSREQEYKELQAQIKTLALTPDWRSVLLFGFICSLTFLLYRQRRSERGLLQGILSLVPTLFIFTFIVSVLIHLFSKLYA